MYRTALLRSARCLAQASTQVQRPAIQRAIRSPFMQTRISTPATSISAIRSYASSSGLGSDEVTGRIIDLLKNFDKVRSEGYKDERTWANSVLGSGCIKGTIAVYFESTAVLTAL